MAYDAEFGCVPPDAPASLRALYDLWRGDDGAARISEQIGQWRNHVAHSIYHARADDVFVHRAGRAVQRLVGANLSGRRFSELLSVDALSAALAPYREAARYGAPQYEVTALTPHHRIARLILPIAQCGDETRFLVALYRMPPPAATLHAAMPQERAA